MSMVYLKDDVAQKLKDKASEDKRTVSAVVEILLEKSKVVRVKK